MAVIHRATLTVSKLELLGAWLPGHPWYDGPGDVEQVGAYRFDDPAGEVGLEAFLLRAPDGALLHVPVTYRAQPLADAEHALVGTTDHSVLGRRWVYDGCADPVWVQVLVAVVHSGGAGAEEVVQTDDGPVPRDPTMTVVGSGSSDAPVPVVAGPVVREEPGATVLATDGPELVVVRTVGTPVEADEVLTGRWADGGSGVLAGLRSRP